ncbi:MAG: hypothetical protein NTZ17_08890, partial [Phycisphaerae bacterium]|nr:hypothetical protein [Phycisphaerae bacterium]
MTADGQYTYTYDPENRLTQVVKPNPPAQQLNSFAAYTKGGDAVWVADGSGFAKSGSISDDQESWMYIDVSGPGTVQFQWKVSSQLWCDCLKFTVDGVNRGEISGQRNWQQETYTLTGTGSHRLQWRYYKDSSEYAGDDCGYVKAVTFTPPALPAPDYLAQAVDSELAFTTGGLGPWQRQTGSPS